MSGGKIARIDFLGRVVVPVDMRKQLGIDVSQERKLDHTYDTEEFKESNTVEILCDGNQVIIRPLHSLCTFCGDPADDTVMDKGICDRCAKLVRSL